MSFENELRSLRKTYSHLSFDEKEIKRSFIHGAEPINYIQVSGMPQASATKLNFFEMKPLLFLLENTNQLNQVQILKPGSAVRIDNRITVFMERRKFLPRNIGIKSEGIGVSSPRIPSESFNIKIEQQTLPVFMGESNVSLLPYLIPYLGHSDLSATISAGQHYQSFHHYDKEELDFLWNGSIAALLVGFSFDIGFYDEFKDGVWKYIPQTYLGWNAIVFEVDQSNLDSGIIENWKDVVEYITFEYYRKTGYLLSIANYEETMVSKTQQQFDLSEMVDMGFEELEFKQVPTNLIQYITTAEQNPVPTFQYLSFYNILEYFFDEPMYQKIYNDTERILSSLDLIEKRNEYAKAIALSISQYAKSYENQRMTLRRTLELFIPFTTIEQDLPDHVIDTMEESVRFEGGLRLTSVNLKESEKFFGDLSTRIYDLRNTIVHSRKGEILTKGGIKMEGMDIQLLRNEVEIIRSIAINTVARSLCF